MDINAGLQQIVDSLKNKKVFNRENFINSATDWGVSKIEAEKFYDNLTNRSVSMCPTAFIPSGNISCDGKIIAPPPTGRNKPCRCGSGKNLKNCCGR